nr:hypothetical protein [Tanacetum cinerariifolium]
MDAFAKLTRAKLNKRSRDADLSKDKSGPESPLESQRSWTTFLERTRSGQVVPREIPTVMSCSKSQLIWSQTHTPGQANGVFSYFQLGDEGLCSRGTKLNSIFITAEHVSGLNDKLDTSDASFAKSKAKGKERKKKIKYLSKSLDKLHYDVAHLSGLVWKFLASDEFSKVQGELLSLAASERLSEASPFVAQTNYAFLNKVFEYVVEPLSVILQLEPEKLFTQSLELSDNVVPASSVVALEQNKEHGTSYVLDDVIEVTVVRSERVSSSLTDVVVALSTSEKSDGSAPSSTVEEVVVPPFGV